MSVIAEAKAIAPPRFQMAYINNSTSISGVTLALANSVVVAHYFGFAWGALWFVPAVTLLLSIVVFGFRKNAGDATARKPFEIGQLALIALWMLSAVALWMTGEKGAWFFPHAPQIHQQLRLGDQIRLDLFGKNILVRHGNHPPGPS